MEATIKPQELSFPLPRNPHTILQAHLTFFETSMMLFLTTSTIGESSSALAPMGSFVYAMPNVCQSHCRNSLKLSFLPIRINLTDSCSQRINEKDVISTALYESGSSIDYATRTAKILARRTKQPVYVGCSMNFAGTTIDEEMEGLTKVINTVLSAWDQHKAT